MRDLDETDMEILSLLAENARRPFSAIGEEVGLSGPAVSDRITRLQESGASTTSLCSPSCQSRFEDRYQRLEEGV